MEANTPQAVQFKTNQHYFFDSAAQCFDACVKEFNSKDLSAKEKTCVKSCFSKQQVVIGSL